MRIQPYRQARLISAMLPLVFLASSCSDEQPYFAGPDSERLPFEFSATIDQDNTSRADESGFADGDRMGVFVVNYRNNAPDTLSLSSNQANNVAVSFNAESGKWTPATDIYWIDQQTRVDVYGYYPFNNGLADVKNYSFEVRTDQSAAGGDGDMAAYEASDFLWAKAPGMTPGNKVNLTYVHALAGVKVTLEPGSGFTGDEWAKLPRIVTVDNTIRTSTIDLSTGAATPVGAFDRNIVMNPEDECYRAVVIPQTVAAGKSTIGITIDGVACNFVRDGGMVYTPGKLHTFNIKVNRTENSGTFSLELTGEQITPWEADNSSHDFEANSYLVVNVPVAGTLQECLRATGADYTTVKNLKVTGQLTDEDFRFMREDMSVLTAVNLKETKMVHIKWPDITDYGWSWDGKNYRDDALPFSAFAEKKSLRSVVLPETIENIGSSSFYMTTLTGTIIIPESVTTIGPSAFGETKGAFTIKLPNRLEKIDSKAFSSSTASIDLNLPNTLKYIGKDAFHGTPNATGTFALPSNLEYLGEWAFSGCGTNLDGNIDIPVKIKVIPSSAFYGTGFRKAISLNLHDGVTQIESEAFHGLKFSGPIVFPKDLTSIGEFAFYNCKFTGEIQFPNGLSYIGRDAFGRTNLRGSVKLPDATETLIGTSNEYSGGPFSRTNIENLIIGDRVEQIESYASAYCSNLCYVEIGKNVSIIEANAFAGCPGISTIVCLAKEPPTIDSSSFPDVDLTNCTVEVPETSVEAYRQADGWRSFHSITAHHELSLSLSEIYCLNKGISRELVVNAEGPWEIAEIPAWLNITPDHADYKEEIKVKVDPLAAGAGDREGRIVFRLKESGYTNYMTVRQYDYTHEEDKEIVLQTASGRGNAIPLFIVGEGYGAKSIANGDYLKRVKETVDQFFAIEPFKTYRNMFTVSTTISLSPDDGAPDVLSKNQSKFSFTFPEIDDHEAEVLTSRLKDYVKTVSSHIDNSNIKRSVIIMLSNYEAFAGSSYHCTDDGCAIACLGISNDIYPYDNRGLVQNLAGGAAFGGLATEEIHHFEFIKGCTCPSCNMLETYHTMKARGLFENVTISGKMDQAPWRDFIFQPKYSAIVDMYEGGCNHLRGVWRSEAQSVMSNYIPYYNTISRYAIYKQIMHRAGLTPSLEDFIAYDKIEIPQ